MSNFEKYEYWLDLCEDDLTTAKWLLEGNRLLHCGFFCHLIAEKALKAVIANETGETPEKTHDLQKLANQGNVLDKLSEQQLKFLDELMSLQIEARYPEYKEKISQSLNKEYCVKMVEETEVFLCWTKQLLGK